MIEVVKGGLIKLLDASMTYPISNSPWVSLVQCVPKKGTTMMENEHNELIALRKIVGCRMCINYRNLNEATQKDHFPFPFINRMLEKLAGKASKVEVIAKLQPPNCVKVVRSFLRHVGLYRRFVKDFSKIAKPFKDLLAKDANIEFSKECLRALNFLKQNLVSAPMVTTPNWSLPFKLICDASDTTVGAVLGQR